MIYSALLLEQFSSLIFREQWLPFLCRANFVRQLSGRKHSASSKIAFRYIHCLQQINCHAISFGDSCILQSSKSRLRFIVSDQTAPSDCESDRLQRSTTGPTSDEITHRRWKRDSDRWRKCSVTLYGLSSKFLPTDEMQIASIINMFSMQMDIFKNNQTEFATTQSH